ncbi:protein FAR1-RELATED SEQUENCE 5-like [Dendrobium catenatum]|uniref:protein FAR1-RELATED SEQUENCE 5-like n=1 Tax=Dendrobium catenatum TaxID=906689 RepID=UPI0009F6024F|nr:protein FAR1-RELATED SEQUENCE 5-like [Dendrobium catenatum]
MLDSLYGSYNSHIPHERNREVFEEMDGSNVDFAFEDLVNFEETPTLTFDEAFSELIQYYRSLLGMNSFLARYNVSIHYYRSGVYNSKKEAYEKYCQYAHSTRFSVRKDHHHFWPNIRKIKSKDFMCSKSGFKKANESDTKVKYRRSCTRTGCPAMVRFLVSQDGVWAVNKSIESHNHELARPDDQHLLKLSRSISDDNAAILKSMSEVGIRTVDAFTYLSNEVGGVGNLGFKKQDAYNYIQKERIAKIETGDTNSLIKLFKKRAIDDNIFAWDVETDEDGCLLNFFWVDDLGRIDYAYFGDVIIFNNSYRLNKYNLACAPVVGVNNHWQNVLLGVAFLSDETIASFTWLFRTFIKIMDNKHPITIFIDQDQAMARAIEIALHHARHRLCQWHLYKEAPSNYHIVKLGTTRYHSVLLGIDIVPNFSVVQEGLVVGGGAGLGVVSSAAGSSLVEVGVGSGAGASSFSVVGDGSVVVGGASSLVEVGAVLV